MTGPQGDRAAQMFPVLTPAQIETARRFASGPPIRYAAGDTLFAVGQRHAPAFLILSGHVVISRGGEDGGVAITRHGPGSITGEISQLAGRPAMAEGRVDADGCEAVPFDAAHLRALLIGSAELGEIVMRAFILRRTAFIAQGNAGSVLVGRPGSPALTRIEGFLARNGYPLTVLDAEADGLEIARRLGLQADDLPVVVCPDGQVLKRPTEAEVAACLGITPELDPAYLYDVAIVGAGPGGMAAAVYAASEGLSVIVLEARAFGGQAGASARIENYLGFPTGITGMALMARAFTQAQKFGAEIAIPLTVQRLECGGPARRPSDPFVLHLTNGSTVRARSVVVASGARYRRPDIANLDLFDGAGVSYWASPLEARLCAGEDIALVGAGNSAGQAVAFLAPKVRSLHLVVRAGGLQASMSRYLIDRIAALQNVTLHTQTEVSALQGDAETGLAGASFRNRTTGKTWTGPLRHLFLFIGADPNTDWLSDCSITLDAKGFVTTGGEPQGDAWASASRRPSPLETSMPGIFAIGDVRAGSTKRVAAAVGEGAQVVAALHGVLA